MLVRQSELRSVRIDTVSALRPEHSDACQLPQARAMRRARELEEELSELQSSRVRSCPPITPQIKPTLE